MRIWIGFVLLGLVAAENELCTKNAADQVINQLHDDLDDDDDGTISNTENRAFISEYGGAASSIGALLDDADGKVSKKEFLAAWRSSAVHNWTTDEVVVWIKSADLNFPAELSDKLSQLFYAQNIDGSCFPLLAKLEQDFLKRIGINQHLVRRKIALRSMDAILFGPPVHDNTIKDFVLAVLGVFVVFSVTFIFRLKRQFRDVQNRLKAEQGRLSDLDHMWKEFSGESTPGGDNDSASTILDIPAELSQLNTYKRENEQLRRSLEEAHRELRTLQEGGSLEHIQINAELKSLLQRTYRIEKDQLDVKRQEARVREKAARDNMKKIQNANKSFFSSVQLIHSHQLDQVDKTIHSAQKAIEDVMIWQRDCRDRWRKLEVIFKVNFILRSAGHDNASKTPPAAHGSIRDLAMSASSERLKNTRLGVLQHQHSVETSITEFGSKQSTVSEDSCLPKSQNSNAESAPRAEINGNHSEHPSPHLAREPSSLAFAPSTSSSAIPDSSIDSGSVNSSQSHIKVKKNKFSKLPFFDRKRFVNLSFRSKKSKHKD
jgi:stromal interaction molecule 1